MFNFFKSEGARNINLENAANDFVAAAQRFFERVLIIGTVVKNTVSIVTSSEVSMQICMVEAKEAYNEFTQDIDDICDIHGISLQDICNYMQMQILIRSLPGSGRSG